MKKIMVIDDNEDTVELVKTLLEMKGFRPMIFTRGMEALEQLKKGVKPDLIVLDVRMPDISGVEFCEAVRNDKSLKNLKIVFFTASTEIETDILKKYRVLGYILKPFANKEFIGSIERYLKP